MFNIKKSSIIILLLAFTFLFEVGCSDDKENPVNTNTGPTQDIVETAISAGNFTTLVAAVQAAGLVDALKGDGPLTVFAPTDEAFAALPEGTIESLLKDTEALAAILTYHVVSGEVKANQVVNLSSALTLNGESVSITITNDSKVMIDNATVTVTDIETTNGVIHVIDAVIIPSNVETRGISDIAKSAGLNTLVAALEAADLKNTLNLDGPFTVFAPSEDAFAALPAGTVEALLQDKEALTDILLYHVVLGVVKAKDVVNLSEATTLNGKKVNISATSGVKINSANVIATDIKAINGVVHLIDAVLIPE